MMMTAVIEIRRSYKHFDNPFAVLFGTPIIHTYTFTHMNESQLNVSAGKRNVIFIHIKAGCPVVIKA